MITSQDTALVVRSRMPLRRRLLWAAVAAGGLALILWASYDLGLKRAGHVREQAAETRRALQAQIERLRSENADLKAMLARAERQAQIQSAAYRELDRSLRDTVKEIAELREKLSFYRSIISPANNRRGLRIRDLKIEPAGADNRFRYRLVLIQALDHRRVVRGWVGFEVLGMQNGRQRTIRLAGGREGPFAVKFRYFQNMEGVFTLPAGFKPLRIKVSVSTNDKRTPKLERWYRWPLA